MKTENPPKAWLALRPGEMMHSKMPYHRLLGIVAALAAKGVFADLCPSPTGYFVKCQARAAPYPDYPAEEGHNA